MQDVYQKPQRVARIRRSLFTIDTLRPLFDLHDLEEFVLEWPYAVKLDEGGIQEMVASWPNLVVLYLTPVPFFILPERPSIHLESLRLLSPLRRLKKLAVFVDAVDPLSLGTVRPTNDDAGINPNCSLREFDPGRSWISKWQYAANMLVSMFPNVRFPDVERRDTIWGDVARVVRDQRSTRGVL
ncbi:hypothetical protein FRB99_005055 [Tulasnella sp. 403]|nr:hypothetical protein FRB99_005055 [Tulasnella sp. 403]